MLPAPAEFVVSLASATPVPNESVSIVSAESKSALLTLTCGPDVPSALTLTTTTFRSVVIDSNY